MEGHIVWYMLGELGILTGFVALLFRRFEKKLDKREQEKARKEATAEAVQRIPDAHCNGDMHEALTTAKKAKKDYRDFQAEQTVEYLH